MSDRTAANNWFIVELQQRIENLLTALTSYYIANANCYLLAHGLQPLTRRIRVACKKKKKDTKSILTYFSRQEREKKEGVNKSSYGPEHKAQQNMATNGPGADISGGLRTPEISF